MDGQLSATLFAALLGAVSSFFAPVLIRRIPEPEPVPVRAEDGSDPRVDESGADSEPKTLYADIAGFPGLALRAASYGTLGAALLGFCVGWDWSLLVLLPLVPVMVALSVVDWHTRLLPTWVIRPTYYLTIGTLVVVAVATGAYGDLGRAALGWLTAGAFFFVLWFVNSGGLGYGDVRLSGILGLALGHLGWAELLTGIWSAFLLGGILGGVLALVGVVDRKGVPFGPFMVLGALAGVVVGPWVGQRLG